SVKRKVMISVEGSDMPMPPAVDAFNPDRPTGVRTLRNQSEGSYSSSASSGRWRARPTSSGCPLGGGRGAGVSLGRGDRAMRGPLRRRAAVTGAPSLLILEQPAGSPVADIRRLPILSTAHRGLSTTGFIGASAAHRGVGAGGF